MKSRVSMPILASLVIAAASLIGWGCNGSGGDDLASPDKNGQPMPQPMPASPACADGGVCESESIKPPTPANINRRILRRLSPEEYGNTVADLVGLQGFARKLPSEMKSDGFDNNAGAMRTDTDFIQAAMDAAKDAAAAPELKLDLGGCGDASCARTFISNFGLRAFRRPLSTPEVDRYLAVYSKPGNHTAGTRAVAQGMLASPYFLFRSELGTRTANGMNALTHYEVATELAYLFWASPPDSALLDAAKLGRLGTKAEVLQQAERLLKDKRSEVSVHRFVRQWLGLDSIGDKAKDAAKFPGFSPAVQQDLAAEPADFFSNLVASADGTLKTLLTANFSVMGSAAASYYGATAISGSARVMVPGRNGILTSGGVLAVGASAETPTAILRGKLVRNRLLCQAIGAPPANAAAVTATLKRDNNRELAGQLTTLSSCSSCHQKMDPIGLTYEGFGATGKATNVSDTSGSITGSRATDGTFAAPAELHAKLATSDEVQACFVSLWMKFGYGISDSSESTAMVEGLKKSFIASDTNLKALLLSLTQTDHFMKRVSDPEDTSVAPGGTAPTGSGTAGNDAGGVPTSDAGTPPGPMGAGTAGVVLEPQSGCTLAAGCGGGGIEIQMRGYIKNTSGAPISAGWKVSIPKLGSVVRTEKIQVNVEGSEWVLRSDSPENATLPVGANYYVAFQFKK
jgi:hypothetical protein